MLQLDIRKQLSQFEVAIHEEIPIHGVTALFGPSGSGKTTILRLIAGFEQGIGAIRFNETTWFDSSRKINLLPNQRPVGYVHQYPTLLTHLDVQGNLNLPLRFNKKRAQRVSLNHVVDIFELGGLLDRRTPTLSGGERQRVAMGQMVLSQPELILLDEPLTGLDLDRKAEILPFLRTLSRELAIPTIYVSHEVEEISNFCERAIVIDRGLVKYFDQTSTLFEHLDLHTLSGRLEAGSIINAEFKDHDEEYGLSHLQIDGQTLSVPLMDSLSAGQSVRIRTRARDVSIATTKPENISIRNVLMGCIEEIEAIKDSPFVEITIKIGTATVLSRITKSAVDSLQLEIGQTVYALIKSVSFDSL
ncbi:MAG: molybdenum ABC transporter ATP-binding protein [Gammaproteobacteria bacterium]|nr:molybdenum ABC transporter ATP-binding protein [Gammaproteobacteria bacterium]